MITSLVNNVVISGKGIHSSYNFITLCLMSLNDNHGIVDTSVSYLTCVFIDRRKQTYMYK